MSGISSSTSSRCLGGEEILGTDPYADLDRETVSAILAEVDHLARTKLAESFADGDDTLPVFDPKTHSVTVPEDVKKSFRALMDSGTWQLELPAELGGQPTHHRFSGRSTNLTSAPIRRHLSTRPAPSSRTCCGQSATSVIGASPRS